jgi:hypothetical protein
MRAEAEQSTAESARRASAHQGLRRTGGEQAAEQVANWPAAAAQRRLADLAHRSAQAQCTAGYARLLNGGAVQREPFGEAVQRVTNDDYSGAQKIKFVAVKNILNANVRGLDVDKILGGVAKNEMDVILGWDLDHTASLPWNTHVLDILRRPSDFLEIRGHFTDVPAGGEADWDGNHFAFDFRVGATFEPYRSAPGGLGEYRQFVRGYMSVDNEDQEHLLLNGASLDRGVYREDGTQAGRRYGYRADNAGEYVDDEKRNQSACEVRDEPGFGSAANGHQVQYRLEFIGRLVDARTGRRLAGDEHWTVKGGPKTTGVP